MYLHDDELEVCSGEYAIVFSAALVAYLGLPSVNLAANDCANVTLHRENMNPVSEYAVEVTAPITGMVSDDKYSDIIGFVNGPKGKPLDDHFYKLNTTTASFSINVYYRRKTDGSLNIATCGLDDRWSVTLRVAN